MKEKKLNKNFVIFLISISLMSILMTNFDSFVSYNSGTSPIMLIASVPFYFVFHNYYYMMFKKLNTKKNVNISTAMMKSSIVGATLMIILTIFNFTYSSTRTLDIENTNTLTNLSLVLILIISVISGLVLFLHLNKKENKNILQPLLFYIINLFVSQFLFIFLLISTGAFG